MVWPALLTIQEMPLRKNIINEASGSFLVGLILSVVPRRSRGAESKDLIAPDPSTRLQGSLRVSPLKKNSPRAQITKRFL